MNTGVIALDPTTRPKNAAGAPTDGSTAAEAEPGSGQSASFASSGEDRRAARRVYRESVAAGAAINQQALGNRFGRSRSWAKARMGEVQALWEDGPTDAPEDPTSDGPSTIANEGHRRSSDAGPAPREARVVVWTALLLGIAVSIAANVMHAQQETNVIAAWIGSAFWPVALLLALEIVTRVPWPHGNPWYAAARLAGIGLVALVAAIQSYRHMAELLLTWGEDPLSAYLGPLAVDGLMLVAATALLASGRGAEAEERGSEL